jgi:hypothetical protein
MDYGRILGRAWEITWRWKILWILGFLASLGQGASPGNSSSYTADSQDLSNWSIDRWGIQWPTQELVAGILGIIVAVACLAILVGIALWVISTISRGGLIAGVQQVEDEGQTTFRSAWRVGVHRFWTLFGIAFLAAIPIIILVIILVVALIAGIAGTGAAADAGGGTWAAVLTPTLLCGGALCCGAVLLGIVLAQIRIYAERAAILEGLGWIEAFKRGWEVLKDNLAPTIIFWLIFLVIGLVVGFVIVVVLAGVGLPFAAILASIDIDVGPWLLAPLCCGGILFAIVAALLNSVANTFTSATWTLVYREMTGLASLPPDEPVVEPIVDDAADAIVDDAVDAQEEA